MARVSELLALTWAEVRLNHMDDAEVEFAWQIDRRGERGPTKTDGSARTVPIPRELAALLVRHKLASQFSRPDDYVFATRMVDHSGSATRAGCSESRSTTQ